MPSVANVAKMAGEIGLYNPDTEDVDLKLLFTGLEETLKKCEGLPVLGITFTKKDLELWMKRIREADKKTLPSSDEDEG